MMKNIFKKLGGAFLGLALGLGVVAGVASAPKASEVKADELSLSGFGSELTSSSASGTMTISGYDITYGAAKKQDSAAFLASGSGFMANATAMPGAINSITVYANSSASATCAYHVKFGTSAFSAFTTTGTQSSTITPGSSQKFNNSVTGATYFVISCVSKNGQVLKIDVDYTAGGTPTTNYTVTFDVQGHGTAPAAATVASGGKVTKPADPSASGYTFGGWYKETGCTTAWVFDTDTVSKDTTIYAKWTENGGGGGDTPSGEYTLVTSVSSLKSNDKVIVALAGTSGPATGVTGMNTNNKDATVSGTQSEWVEYTVTISGAGFTLSSGSSYINFADKVIKYGDASVLNVTTDGYLCLNSTPTMILFNQQTFYRPYTGKLGTSEYTPFSVYKVGAIENVDLTDISLESTSEVIVGSTVDLVPIKTPSNANNKVTFTWESLTPSVATVVDGKVTGVSVGTATIRINATDIGKSATCTVTVNPVPPVKVDNTIADCYTIGVDKSVSFNGLYMGTYGTSAKDGIFFADGAYGILIYGTTSVPSGWEVGKTVVAVKGTTANFNGLVQVKNATFELTSATVSTPEVYTFLGNETTAVALSRKTSISGTIASISGQTDNKFVSGTDGKVTVTLDNGGTAMIFIKKNVHTSAELDEFSEKLVVGSYVVATGFLNYYKGGGTYDGERDPACFQIVAPTIISTSKYDAEAFAKDFLADTDAICSVAKDDHSSELLAAWSDIAAKYTALDDTERAAVVAADAKADTDLGKAVARYDYLVAKYGLNEFIEGRTVEPIRTAGFIANSNNNTSTIIIVIVSVVSLTTLGALIMIKRRKTTDK